MRASFLSARALAVSSLLAVVGIVACREATTESVAAGPRPGAVAEPLRALDAVYGGCQATPQQTCTLNHPGSTVTAYCAYGACFEMSYGEVIRVVAADELGPFPQVWFAWRQGAATPTGSPSCIVTQRGNKSRVEIPAPSQHCQLAFATADYVYHEYFASNAVTGCLAWVECRVPRE